MSEEKNKLDFDISKMTEEELLKAYDMIKGFLDYLKDNKIETVVVSDGKILDNSLVLCQKNKKDVLSILKKEKIKLNDVFIMTLDALGKYNVIKKERSK